MQSTSHGANPKIVGYTHGELIQAWELMAYIVGK